MYRWVEHTGELELEIEAPTDRAVFEHGFEALRDLLAADAPAAGAAQPLRRASIRAEARDRAALLADWLGELALLAERERLVPQRLVSLELGERELHAVVEGRAGQPPHLVKAATYHRLSLEPAGDGWHATVVLDV